VILLWLLLWRIPIAFGFRTDMVVRTYALLPFMLLIGLDFKFLRDSKMRVRLDRQVLVLGAVFVAVELVSLVRTAFWRISFDTIFIAYQLVSLLILVASVFLAYAICGGNETMRAGIRRAFLGSFGVYILANLLLHSVGVVHPDTIFLADYPAQMLSLLGIPTHRVLFPMAEGINGFGVFAGLGLSCGFPLLFSRAGRAERIAGSALVLACIGALLLVDSRGSVIFALVAGMIALLPWRFLSFARWYPLAVSVLPLLIGVSSSSSNPTSLAWLNRPKSVNAVNQSTGFAGADCERRILGANGFLSNRPIIWKAGVEATRGFGTAQIFGWGYRGQITSGLSDQYSCLFKSYAMPEIASLHSVWLQLLVDVGYLGVIVVLLSYAVLVLRISRLERLVRDPAFRGMLGGLLFIVSVGALEATLSPDFYGAFFFFALVLAIAGQKETYES
jgi:hypothetical protein